MTIDITRADADALCDAIEARIDDIGRQATGQTGADWEATMRRHAQTAEAYQRLMAGLTVDGQPAIDWHRAHRAW